MTPRRTRKWNSSRLLGALFAVVLAASLAPPALATPLSGSPLTVHVGDRGQLQAFRAGSPNGIFYRPTSIIGDAGFFLAFPTGAGNPAALEGDVFGFQGNAGPDVGGSGSLVEYTPGTQQATTGSGTAADPLTQVTTYSAGGVTVTQTTTYVNGAQSFLVRWNVHNGSGTTVRFKALAAADFFFEGDDAGTGIFTAGPPRFIGGTNADTGNSGGFEEVLGAGLLPWSTYQALDFPTVWSKIQSSATSSPTFDGSVLATPDDNAGGVEWDQLLAVPGLANNGDQAFSLRVRNAVPAALRLLPPNAGAPRGVPIKITALATDTNGSPYAGRLLRYYIIGPNAGSGTRTLGAFGTATITDPGTVAGRDAVVAFVDFNGDGERQPVEPQASALATFVDSIAPSCRVSVSGTQPGGSGAGKPLVINVNCNEPASVRVATTLRVPRNLSSANAAATRRTRNIKLKAITKTALPGKRVPVRIKIPKSVRRKYAGKRLTAKVTIKVTDASRNAKTIKRSKKIKLRKLKKRGS
jgi:hypothetical protein